MLDAKQTRPSPVIERVWLRKTRCGAGIYWINITLEYEHGAVRYILDQYHTRVRAWCGAVYTGSISHSSTSMVRCGIYWINITLEYEHGAVRYILDQYHTRVRAWCGAVYTGSISHSNTSMVRCGIYWINITLEYEHGAVRCGYILDPYNYTRPV